MVYSLSVGVDTNQAAFAEQIDCLPVMSSHIAA